jgi:hypothetical protein
MWKAQKRFPHFTQPRRRLGIYPLPKQTTRRLHKILDTTNNLHRLKSYSKAKTVATAAPAASF